MPDHNDARPDPRLNPKCILHEDEHILVVNKPAGINTHSPSPHAGEGIYEWLRNADPRWADLAIIHRLDKATSGLIIFAKSKLANRSLTQQFTERKVTKRYLLVTTARPHADQFTVRSALQRAGERYTATQPGDYAETQFEYLRPDSGRHLLAATPFTGRTHQIRAHAELKGFPILGDTLYGGTPFPRVCLHAQTITFRHPETGKGITFESEPDFSADPSFAIRQEMIAPETDSFRLLNGAADDAPGLYLEKWGPYLLAQSETPLSDTERERMLEAGHRFKTRGAYHKLLNRQVRRASTEQAAPVHLNGEAAPQTFTVRENGVAYEISFEQGYSVGLFLDQRENRRRILRNYIAPNFPLFEDGLTGKEILNTFSYTCAFSVCAAIAGARATSLDLSRKYLDWGRRNFLLNNLDPARHDYIYGDVFDWAPRLHKKSRQFDLIILDPPTFSQAKGGTLFQAEKHYSRLVETILPLLNPGGLLLASTNARKLPVDDFLGQISEAAARSRRPILQQHYAAQPFDFPISREEPAYLKTVWIRFR